MKKGTLSFAIAIALLLTGGARPLFAADDHVGRSKAGANVFSVDDAGAMTIPALTSCDTIDTDANGKLSCGTDSGAGVDNSTFSFITVNNQTITNSVFDVCLVNSTNTITVTDGLRILVWVSIMMDPSANNIRFRILKNGSVFNNATEWFRCGSSGNVTYLKNCIATFHKIASGTEQKTFCLQARLEAAGSASILSGFDNQFGVETVP